MRKKRWLGIGLAAVTLMSAVAASGCGAKSGDGDADTFSWWIYSTDGAGTYYDDYSDNPAVEWLNQQYWDVENGGLGTEENGTNVKFTFQAPIAGSESDNFNTMLSTGEYTDIVDLAISTDSAETLCDEGILMDLTEYVEKYMPNYLAYLEENPTEKALVTNIDEDGKTHYYQLAAIKDGNDVPWGGFVYRRDWVVEYAEPTAYVWDWDSDYVKENGHPEVTPLDAAIAANNLNGWKENEVKEFTSTEGEDPKNDYQDNVIFPSGMSDPYTVSDWEWMFEAFQKAIDDKGFSGDSNAYCTTTSYVGFYQTGDLVSSFGGGTGSWSRDENNDIYFSGTEDSFKTYLECMNTWYDNGWLDTAFETRASDMFFSINETGCTQGKVGMWYGTVGVLGDTIRVTCADAEDQQKAYVMGCSVPVNDMYGSEEQKFVAPDAFYQGSRVSGSIGVTTAAEDKDLAALFTFFDWLYTEDGAMVKAYGLNSEQLAEVADDNSVYADLGLTEAYKIEEGEDGSKEIVMSYPNDSDYANALRATRLTVGRDMTGSGANLDYALDDGKAEVTYRTLEQFTRYTSTADLLQYTDRMTPDESDVYSSVSANMLDYVAQEVPKMIKNGTGDWDTYVETLEGIGIDDVTEAYQRIMDDLYGK